MDRPGQHRLIPTTRVLASAADQVAAARLLCIDVRSAEASSPSSTLLSRRGGWASTGGESAPLPANLVSHEVDEARAASVRLGPCGPFPDARILRVLERRWLHYAFVSTDGSLALVANVARLGLGDDSPTGQRTTSILLLHERGHGWSASQYNARTHEPLWSSFRNPHPHGATSRFELGATSAGPAVKLKLNRTSRACTSQSAPFRSAPLDADQHLRWQAETGVVARGDWTFGTRAHADVQAIGYHERVRGYWGWPELGGWVFGFANDPAHGANGSPRFAVVFTLIQPLAPRSAATASVMLWRDGRLARHFPRRRVSVAMRGELDQSYVMQVPAQARLFGTPPMRTIPRRLVIAAGMGEDELVLDFCCENAARVVVPSETGIDPFSVHEVLGAVQINGRVAGYPVDFQTQGIVEFAGGASVD
jgi:hypothetical protein